MKVENYIHMTAGALVFIGVVLGFYVHPGWLVLSAAVGLNLLQYAFTEFCPLAVILRRLGVSE
jgi:hypothetical protein